MPKQLKTGLMQGSPLFPLLYNVYTKGLADLNRNCLTTVLTLADNELSIKQPENIQQPLLS